MRRIYKTLLIIIITSLVVVSSQAARISDIAGTRHNLSASGQGNTKATTEDEMCVFCHTPHGATNYPGAPLWNREIQNQTYTVYTSSSLDAEDIMGQLDQPGGSSKLCLSCHDGTIALGTVNVLGGQQNVSIDMSGTDPDGSMPGGIHGAQSGFTRDLGIDLRNDHPIAMDYDAALASADSELINPLAAAHIGLRGPGIRPLIPLEATGSGGEAQIQCASCHDPHIRDTDPSLPAKFLRLNRFQQNTPVGGSFNDVSDIVCLGCHDKEGWETSAHALPSVANETYTAQAADDREFPPALPVWQASCLNCHDAHAVHGTRRLLREGTDSLLSPKSGGNPALEESCYQCHTMAPVVSNAAGEVKDIESDFNSAIHMPISNLEQSAGSEVHDITDANFRESQTLLGKFNLNNRHAECTDCHNPHRLMKNSLFNATGSDLEATHEHAGGHSNIASGVLRGTWGVEPLYGAAAFPSLPSSYIEKEGDGGSGASSDVTSPWLTREYQLCLKCHSDYAYDDNNAFPTGTRPNLGGLGSTTSNTNGLSQYTNQAVEFQAPLTHAGEPGGLTGSGAGSLFEGANIFSVGDNGPIHFNHRSWHPVIDSSGRTAGVRAASANAWLAPWNTSVGNQTMYCSDCHGSNTTGESVEPNGNNPWGPHGSSNNFLLKGSWNGQTGSDDRDWPAPDPKNGLCFKCHDVAIYADRNGENLNSGFSGSKSNNLHAFHADNVGSMHCMWCHTAVPHGFKNKALLVNLNDAGPETGQAGNTEIASNASNDVYNQEPYYFNAKLKVRTFAQSGNWEDTNCGSAGNAMAGNNTTFGRDWMRDVCSNPP